MKRSFVILPLISALFLTFASCRQNFFTTNGEAWATTYHIAYFSGRSFADSIEAEIAAIDNELSLFNPRSLVSAVNDCATDSVSRRFAEVFDIGQKVWVLSGGVYDPTIGPVAELWGFGRVENPQVSDSAIAVALGAVGMGECSIIDGRIAKKSPDCRYV